MKTRELIAELQKADPSGEIEVCVGNEPIYVVARGPAYYDGPLGMLIRDGAQGYDIVGYKFTQDGEKVDIEVMGLDDCILDNADLPVDVSEIQNERIRDRILADAEKQRAHIRRIQAEIDAKRSAKGGT